MIILPAIDIKDGQCVRLYKGEFSTAHKVAEDPIKTALGFKSSGAEWMHMVDLDGALNGRRVNAGIITKIAKESGLRVELGGGIRELADIEYYLSNGISRVIIGSAAVENPNRVKNAISAFGAEHIAVGIDARDGLVATRGWVDNSGIGYIELSKKMEQYGVKYIIFTDISRDGTLSGPPIKRLEALKSSVSSNIIASGGVGKLADITALNKIGLYGAICGKAIYTGDLRLDEAIREAGV